MFVCVRLCASVCVLACVCACVYLCFMKVYTMVPLMTLRTSQTSIATMFFVMALVKLSLGNATAPPGCMELPLPVSSSMGLREELDIIIILIVLTCSERGNNKCRQGQYPSIKGPVSLRSSLKIPLVNSRAANPVVLALCLQVLSNKSSFTVESPNLSYFKRVAKTNYFSVKKTINL